MDDINKNQKENYQVYLEERKILIDAERNTAQQFDKAILTLAAGALALSITFINQIAPEPKPNSIVFLIIAWSFFASSILSTLISFLTSQVACRQRRESLDSDLRGEHSNKNACADKMTNILNYFSIGFFVLGVIFLITFSSINLYKGGKIMSKTKSLLNGGYVPQKSPAKVPVKSPDKTGEKGFVPQKPPVKKNNKK